VEGSESTDELYGRLAVELGYITQENLEEAVENQRAMREGMGIDQPLQPILTGKGLLTDVQARDLARAVALETGEKRIVAGYEVATKLGQGAMGTVFKAKKMDTGELVALKVLPPSLADERTVARFARESAIVQELDHDNIVSCVEFGYDEEISCHFCALELVEGEDLFKRLTRDGKLDEEEALSITSQIAMALQHAHFNGLVHRDVKPENIMVTPDGTAKLLDLGLARYAGADLPSVTQSGVFVGSPYYASVEQARGDADLDIRSDVYSLGGTLYHMVTGDPPFEGSSVIEVLNKHIKDTLPWPADVNPELSDGLCRVIAKMMAKSPSRRYQEPNDFLDDLDRLEEGENPKVEESVLHSSSIARPKKPRGKRKRRPGGIRKSAQRPAAGRAKAAADGGGKGGSGGAGKGGRGGQSTVSRALAVAAARPKTALAVGAGLVVVAGVVVSALVAAGRGRRQALGRDRPRLRGRVGRARGRGGAAFRLRVGSGRGGPRAPSAVLQGRRVRRTPHAASRPAHRDIARATRRALGPLDGAAWRPRRGLLRLPRRRRRRRAALGRRREDHQPVARSRRRGGRERRVGRAVAHRLGGHDAIPARRTRSARRPRCPHHTDGALHRSLLVPRGRIAADHYARAFDALSPEPGEELDDFLVCTAIHAAPETLREFPGAMDEVRKYREAVTVHLRRAVSKKRCMFDLNWSEGPAMLMPHLAKARALARRAAAYGKLLELEGRPREAARVYLDTVRMGLHLEQDRTLISVLVGIAVVEIAGPQLEGILAREPDAGTSRLVFEELRGLPRDRFDAARALDFERILMGGWMRRLFPKLADMKREDILRTFGAAPHAPWQVPGDPKAIAREIVEAVGVYGRQMRAMSTAMAGPYHETRAKVARLEKTQTSYWDGEKKAGHIAAVVGNVIPAITAFRARTVRAEARLRGLMILAAASLEKAERGAYPADLAGLARHFPRGVPADPVSGKPFTYWLADGLPAALCEADDPETKEKRPETYHFGLAYGLYLEKHALDKWRFERKRRAEKDTQPSEREADLDEGEGDPDEVP
jgi:serine/threonine-protein kinase